ncbi:MAG TPA: dihydrodipicolinate reductase C-terminal domain-containing protein [Pyrinomonadaceae bacterium]
MKIALIGYGAMGQLVAGRASDAGDEIGATITSQDNVNITELAEQLSGHDVAIDFSVGGAVLEHVEACARADVPLVEGTTGWKEQEADARRIVTAHNGALVFGANFSVGVNVFYRIVAHATSLFAAVEGYEPFIEEAHHSRKRDAPSGTALRLRDLMAQHLSGVEIPIASTRAGHIPGTHRVGFDSVADQITLTHMARSREGFAAGALVAAHWIAGRKGVYEFAEVIDEILKSDGDEFQR